MTTTTETCQTEWREAYGLPISYCLTHGQDHKDCSPLAMTGCRTPGCTLPDTADHATIHSTSDEGLLSALLILTHRITGVRRDGENLSTLRAQRAQVRAEVLRRMGGTR